MATKETKVIYNVKEAIAKLNRLNKKVEESGRKAGKSFGDVAKKGSEKFNQALGKIPGTTGKVIRGVARLTSKFGALGGFAGIAAGSILALGANLIDITGLLRDSNRALDAFAQGSQGILRAQNLVSALSDALLNSAKKRQTRGQRQRQAEFSFIEVRAREIQFRATEELQIAKDVLSKKEAALKVSIDKRLSLEDRLLRRTTPGLGSQFAGLDAGDRSLKLAEEATLQAQKGNLDAAEELLSQAEALGPELQHHALFLDANEKASRAINDEIRRQIEQQKKSNNVAQRGVDITSKRTEELQAQVVEARKITQDITNQKTTIGAEVRIGREAQRVNLNRQFRDEAVRELREASRVLDKSFKAGGLSLKENIIDSFKQSINEFKKAGGTAQVRGVLRGAVTARQDIQPIVDKILSGQSTFGESADLIAQKIEDFSTRIGEARTLVAESNLGGFNRTIEILQREEAALMRLGDALVKGFQADATLETKAIRGTETSFDTFSQRIAPESGRDFGELSTVVADTFLKDTEQAAIKIRSLKVQSGVAADNLKRIAEISGQLGGTSAISDAILSPVLSSETAAINRPPTNINVTTTVQGTVLDREAVEEFSDIIRREVRKEVQAVAQ